MADPTNPHDALAKWTFSNPAEAADLLRSVLPPKLLRLLDLTTLKLVSGSFVDEALRGAYSDLLFSVRLNGKPALVYILFEHLSSVDGWIPVRLLRYLVNILEQHIETSKSRKEALPLPVIIPVVLHHSDSGWTGPTRLGELYDPDLFSSPDSRCFIPDFAFCLDDISHVSDEELRSRSMSAAATLTLWALRDARHPEKLLETLKHFVDLIQMLRADPRGRSAFAAVLRYVLLVADIPFDHITQGFEALAPGTKEDIMTPAEQLRTEGEARGEVRGRRKERVELLLRQLSLRFGELPASTAERVRDASDAELTRWVDRILVADSVDALLRDS